MGLSHFFSVSQPICLIAYQETMRLMAIPMAKLIPHYRIQSKSLLEMNLAKFYFLFAGSLRGLDV